MQEKRNFKLEKLLTIELKLFKWYLCESGVIHLKYRLIYKLKFTL